LQSLSDLGHHFGLFGGFSNSLIIRIIEKLKYFTKTSSDLPIDKKNSVLSSFDDFALLGKIRENISPLKGTKTSYI